ncbi:Ppx/GppA phosphatase family protein [Parvularcula sp. IMCC14364]|uniref:Ppx/GppA phosphatase family protein n=1 Tax=Parvularcula sp. IMCC14364 TaxID=3067902 RepID=UPI002741BF79|nr:Ppx/GppA phosphatase family protein [Parvularcula sp. IMCC14364]
MTSDSTPSRKAEAGGGGDSSPRKKNKKRRQNISARRLKKLKAAHAGLQTPPEGEVQVEKRLEKDWRPAPIFSAKYAAIDLGTNNCRLLIASPHKQGFRVVDAFSRIVRLGEGVSQSGRLSDEAMDRTIEALKICADKVRQRRVTALRSIATQACRMADNGEEFLARVRQETGLTFDLISPEEEAGLSVRGCLDLTDPTSEAVLVFDIGGGSTEISWVRRVREASDTRPARHRIVSWTSIPLGVVSVSERFDGRDLTRETYDEIVELVAEKVRAFEGADEMRPLFEAGRAHLLGTSGTVTSIAGVHLGLKKYNRRDVDGIWLASERAVALSEKLRGMTYEQRQREPCIGPDRADLVVPGCAILEGILTAWPSTRIRVADRGLREGILSELIARDRKTRRKRRRRRR